MTTIYDIPISDKAKEYFVQKTVDNYSKYIHSKPGFYAERYYSEYLANKAMCKMLGVFRRAEKLIAEIDPSEPLYAFPERPLVPYTVDLYAE